MVHATPDSLNGRRPDITSPTLAQLDDQLGRIGESIAASRAANLATIARLTTRTRVLAVVAAGGWATAAVLFAAEVVR